MGSYARNYEIIGCRVIFWVKMIDLIKQKKSSVYPMYGRFRGSLIFFSLSLHFYELVCELVCAVCIFLSVYIRIMGQHAHKNMQTRRQVSAVELCFRKGININIHHLK